MRVHLVNPSALAFGVGVITPRWLYVLAAATPEEYGDPIVTDETLEFGKSHDTYWSAYHGYLDDFRIYNRVLSASEIAQLAGVVVSSPTLNFSLAGGKLTLTWSPSGFVLQENSNLGNPGGWTNVPNGDVSPVVITLPGTGANFYRLKKLP
jgi:hypothetical protein